MMQRHSNQREKRHAINSVASVVIVFALCGGARMQDQIVGCFVGEKLGWTSKQGSRRRPDEGAIRRNPLGVEAILQLVRAR